MSLRYRTASDALREKILDAALTLMSDGGVEALTVRAIATNARVAPMSIYNHFDGKNGIIEALWIQGFEELSEAMWGERDAEFNFLESAERYRSFALTHRASYRLMFMEKVSDFEISLRGSETAAHSLQILVLAVESLQASGTLPTDPPLDQAVRFWSVVHGYVALEILGLNFVTDRDHSFRQLMADYWRGVTGRSIAT